jgi:hypothetical protein
MLAVVRADMVMKMGVHFSLGRPCTRCRFMYTDLPVPVGPTMSSGWLCCRARSSRYVYLQRVSAMTTALNQMKKVALCTCGEEKRMLQHAYSD